MSGPREVMCFDLAALGEDQGVMAAIFRRFGNACGTDGMAAYAMHVLTEDGDPISVLSELAARRLHPHHIVTMPGKGPGAYIQELAQGEPARQVVLWVTTSPDRAQEIAATGVDCLCAGRVPRPTEDS